MITCSRCQRDDLSEDDFPSNGNGKGGRRKQCRTCMREINKEWRKKNREKIAMYNRTRRKDSNGRLEVVQNQPIETETSE